MRSLLQSLRRSSSTADGLFIVDAGQRIVHWNDGARRLFGYAADEVLHRRCYEAIAGKAGPGKAWCHSNCPVQRATRRGSSHRNFDLIVRTKEGKEICANISVIVLARRKESLIVHLVRDITTHERERETLHAVLDTLKTAGCLERENHIESQATSGAPPSGLPLSALTRREVEILSLVAEGLAGSAIARRLGLSQYTVRNHIQNTLEKLRLHSKAQAVSYAFRHGLI